MGNNDLPPAAWIGVGALVFITSVMMGFIRPVEGAGFFKFMTAVGVGMLVYAYISMQAQKKAKLESHNRAHQQRVQNYGPREVEIDINQYRQNPHLRAQAMQGHTSHHTQQYAQHHGFTQSRQTAHHAQSYQQHANQQASRTGYQGQQINHVRSHTQGYCPHCGTPVLNSHKFCPICGNKV